MEMDNYKDTFLKKISFVISMVMYYGTYKVPRDWWDVATVASSSSLLKNCRTKDSADSETVLRVPDCFVHYQLLSIAQCKISQFFN